MKKHILFSILYIVCLSLYAQNQEISKIIIEGELKFVSELPNLDKMDYPDCNYSTIFEVNSDSSEINVNIIFSGIVNKERLSASNFKVGDKLRVTLIPFENTESKVRQTQLVDQVDDFDILTYYALDAKKIKKYSKKTNSKTIVSQKEKVREIEISSIDKKARRIRGKTIKKDLKKIEDLLKSHGGTWEQWEKDLENFKSEYNKANKSKKSKWIGNSFFSAGKAYSNSEGNFVNAMIDFNNYLKQFNIDLIILRIPYKGEVVGDLFSESLSDNITNLTAMKITFEMLKNDIEVIDIVPRLIENRLNYPLMYWYNDFDEIHPGEPISWVAAEEIKNRLKRYTEFNDYPKITTYIKDTTGIRNGKRYRWPKGNDFFPPKGVITYKSVVDSSRNMIQLEYNKNESPFLFIGNSFLAYPSIKRGGSIPHYFTHESGLIPDVYFRSGGVGLGRLIYKRGKSYIEKRRAVIYIVKPTHFQENVPIIPLIANINNQYEEKHIMKLNKTNWEEHVSFFPKLEDDNVFSIEKNENITVRVKNDNELDGGNIKINLPSNIVYNNNEILKVSFNFKSIGYSKVEVSYGTQKKSFLRTTNNNDNSYEEVYFKVNEEFKNNYLQIFFLGVQKPQQIKEIDISIITKKE